MRYSFYLLLTIGLVFGAYQVANTKMEKPLNLQSLHLGMTQKEVQKLFGSPSARNHNQLIFILHDGSEMSVTLRDKKVSSASVRFKQVLKIQDPEMRKLTLVQMAPLSSDSAHPTWFFAGQPEEGLIYKITSEGIIESLTWVPPFTVAQSHPKNLQALMSDFKSQISL